MKSFTIQVIVITLELKRMHYCAPHPESDRLLENTFGKNTFVLIMVKMKPEIPHHRNVLNSKKTIIDRGKTDTPSIKIFLLVFFYILSCDFSLDINDNRIRRRMSPVQRVFNVPNPRIHPAFYKGWCCLFLVIIVISDRCLFKVYTCNCSVLIVQF